MLLGEWMLAAASGCALAVGAVAARQWGRTPLARPLALASLDLAVAHGAALAGPSLVADLAGALAAPLSLELVASFTGASRALRPLRLAALSLSLMAFAARASWGRGPLTASLAALAASVALAASTASLARHARAAAGADELARVKLLAAATAVGAALGATEPLSWARPSVPPLGALATPACVIAAAMASLRFEGLERAPERRAAAYTLGLVALGVAACAAVLGAAGVHRVAGVVGAALVAAASTVALRGVATAYAAERERVRQLATVGRFAAQMAHDLKNPLAVLTGAAQFLKEEHARGNSLADYGDFLDLMVAELDRTRRVIDTYQRLGRVEVRAASVDVNELVRSVLALQRFATDGRIEIRTALAEGVPRCPIDRDLFDPALQNLLRNAYEAMPGAGTLTVTTAPCAPSERDGAVISVEDTGIGMDARSRELALDSFYTTKAEGSGLGLAYVRRVVDAHGGALSLTSVEGRGTVVRVRIPSRR